MRAHNAITRRRAFGLAGAAGATYLVARLGNVVPLDDAVAAPSCVLTPAKTEGPYFVDERLNRSDIRIDPANGTTQPGTKLTLTFVVVRAGDCEPVSGAQVDVWHANASGLYSDEAANGTSGHKYLRGYQVTDEDGTATFVTVFPGWYSGRAIHIHFTVRKDDFEFTSQLFFTESDIAAVMASSAYSSRGTPDTDNDEDSIYGGDGSELTVDVADDGRRVLRLKVHTNEAVSVRARLVRSGRRLAGKRFADVTSGTHRLRVPIPERVRAGRARLVLHVRDAAGNTKVIRRAVRIPSRR